MKTCTKCGLSLPEASFSKMGAVGLRAACKQCLAAQARARYARSADQKREEARARYAKDVEYKREQKRALHAKNVEHVRKMAREARAKKPEQYRTAARAYYAKKYPPTVKIVAEVRSKSAHYLKHRERILAANRKYKRSHEQNVARYAKRKTALSRSNAATPAQVKARFEVFGGLCAYCGEPAQSADHVVPLSRGGSALPANIRPACKGCNSSKGKKKLSEWLALKAA